MSKIDWTEHVWNPITGCLHGCEYCYARRDSRRFCGDVRLNKSVADYTVENGLYTLNTPLIGRANRAVAFPFGFAPTLHMNRLGENAKPLKVKKPSTFFVGAYTDLFGDWVPQEWQKLVFDVCMAAPQHQYIFLTKNPDGLPLSSYIYTGVFDRHPKNMWFGISVTSQKDLERGFKKIINVSGNIFLSIEPLLEPVDLSRIDLESCIVDLSKGMHYYLGGGDKVRNMNWVIIGAETGTRRDKTIPRREWIEKIAADCRAANIPVLMKKGEKVGKNANGQQLYFMQELMGADFVQEWPEGMPHGGKTPPPHCVDCKYYEGKAKRLNANGREYEQHICDFCSHTVLKSRIIPGRYARTSPPWCPKRGAK